jgi:isocitrate/isopropylmalate dehydrogenase
VVVRENTEGVYVGAGGTVHRGGPAEAATETSIETRAGVERVLRYAAAKAQERAGRLTLVHKTNVLVHAGDLWPRTAEAVDAGAVAALPGAAGYSTQALGDRIATAVAGGGSPHRSGGDDAV